jgi:hypothetical protein
MNALVDALGATAELGKLRSGLSQHSLGQKIQLGILGGAAGGYQGYKSNSTLEGAGLGATAGAFLIPKGKFIYAAGKMLANPVSRDLLKKSSDLPPTTAPLIKKYYNQQIMKHFARHAAMAPARAIPFTNGADQSAQENNNPAQ